MSRHTHRRTVLRLVALAVGMFGFGWAMIPLYSVFCEVIGIRSDDIRERTDASSIVTAGVDESRTVRVQFVAIKDEQMPWVFRPETFELKVHPGQRIDTTFFARNVLGQEMTAQAIPSISPGEASLYFYKTECFCFNQQTLAAGEAIDMPLQFIVDRDLPRDIRTITLSYTLYDANMESRQTRPVVAALN